MREIIDYNQPFLTPRMMGEFDDHKYNPVIENMITQSLPAVLEPGLFSFLDKWAFKAHDIRYIKESEAKTQRVDVRDKIASRVAGVRQIMNENSLAAQKQFESLTKEPKKALTGRQSEMWEIAERIIAKNGREYFHALINDDIDLPIMLSKGTSPNGYALALSVEGPFIIKIKGSDYHPGNNISGKDPHLLTHANSSDLLKHMAAVNIQASEHGQVNWQSAGWHHSFISPRGDDYQARIQTLLYPPNTTMEPGDLEEINNIMAFTEHIPVTEAEKQYLHNQALS
jgi:hypothetical protein